MGRETLKQKVIAEYLSGDTSTRKLGKKYGYGNATISRWVMASKDKNNQPPGQRLKDILGEEAMPANVEELQEALRLSRLKVDLLEAMIDISDEQFGTDIRKKAGTSQS